MSYLRYSTPLSWFRGHSNAYVYMGSEMVDYDNPYDDLPTLIELIGIIIERECGDKKFATRIVEVLAAKLNVTDKLRKKRLTDHQILKTWMSRVAKKKVK